MPRVPFFFCCLTLISACDSTQTNSHNRSAPVVAEKMAGVSLVAPRTPYTEEDLAPIQEIGAGWVALLPYGFSMSGDPEIHYNSERQWWGERTEGIIQTAEFARSHGLKIMLKPDIWIRPGGWSGNYDLPNEKSWQTWEENYTKYILRFAGLADTLGIEMLCIGTEMKIATQKRPAFWVQLANKVRAIYSGKLTYAANWDEYNDIEFWGALDYIGINGYFPLDDSRTPGVSVLKKSWQPFVNEMRQVSIRYNRPVIFTEYGYRSVDGAAARPWDEDRNRNQVNLTAQKNAYEAFFQSVWNQQWFAGGFLWQWYPVHLNSGGHSNHDFTPQNKPAEEVIKLFYNN